MERDSWCGSSVIGMLVDHCIINRSYHDWAEELAADMVY